LSDWVGRGYLYEALSLPTDDAVDRRWSAEDIARRANRVLLSLLAPNLASWPRTSALWLDYLPAARAKVSQTRPVPFAGVNWVESSLRFGWPPSAFSGRQAERSADLMVVQVLRWCADRLIEICDASSSIQVDVEVGQSERQLEALASIRGIEPILSAEPSAPTRPDLLSLRREGYPWRGVAEVSAVLLEAQRSQDFLVHQVLMPDDEIRWRLFHLAVLGQLLFDLRAQGCTVTSLRPLSPSSEGPNYRVQHAGAESLLWFEASGVWKYLTSRSPYAEATRGVARASKSNGADILLISPDKSALILECKYSWNQEFVARAGYYQAVAYAAETHSRLAERVVSVAVGPESVVSHASFTELSIGRVGVLPPSALSGLVRGFLEE